MPVTVLLFSFVKPVVTPMCAIPVYLREGAVPSRDRPLTCALGHTAPNKARKASRGGGLFGFFPSHLLSELADKAVVVEGK